MEARYSVTRVFRPIRLGWTTLLSFIAAGVLLPLSTSAQVVVTGQRISTSLNPPPTCTVNTCLQVEAEGSVFQPLCMVTVLDMSWSMTEGSPERWERTRDALKLIVDGVWTTGDEVGLVTYNNTASLESGLTTDSAAFQTTLDNLSGPSILTPYTNTEDGLTDGSALSCSDESAFRVLLLGSDGVPTMRNDGGGTDLCDTSPTSATDCTNEAVDAADSAKADGWHIITLGLDLDPSDPEENFGLTILDSIATGPGSSFNIPEPESADVVVAQLVDLLEDVVASNVVISDTLNSCWDYVNGSTSGDFSDDPLVQTASDGRRVVPYSVPTLADGDTVTVCYDMAYDPSCGGTVPASVSFNNGNVTYDTSEDSGQTDDIPGSSEVDMTSCQSILPVELVEFTAVADNRDIILRWSTASELNNAGFEVEHAFEDDFFEVAGFVEGHGSTNVPREYSFVIRDLEPGQHAFRLRQIDFDGAFEYSGVVEATVEVPDQYFLSEVYPNPFNPQASLRFWVTRSQHVEVALHDIQGRRVMSLYEGTPASKASTLVRIDGRDLSSGTYLVRVQGEDFSDSRHVTVLK